jgi:uncharacterized YccA/Bax inhibitor family protein
MAFRSGNPTLKADMFKDVERVGSSDVMTLDGTVNKVGILLTLVILSASGVWFNSTPSSLPLFAGVGAIGGFIMAMVTIFNKKNAAITAPIYAILEGMFLGAISLIFESSYPGIVTQAVMLTFGIFLSLLLAYKSGAIKATENFKLGVVAATGGIALVYLASFIMGFFGASISVLSSSSPMGIGISVFIVIIAALNLVLDFDFIEEGCNQQAPKYMEWYGAFGLIVTLVWLYLEILRLLTKLQDRN